MKRTSRRWLQAIAAPTRTALQSRVLPRTAQLREALQRKALPRKTSIGIAGACLAGLATVVGVANASSPNPPATVEAAAPGSPAAGAPAARAHAAPAAPAEVPAPKAAQPAPAVPVAQPANEKALQFDFAYQPNSYYCGPASTRIALTVLGQYHPFDDLAGELGTTEAGTDSAFDIARVLNQNLGGAVYHVVEIQGEAANAGQIDKLKHDVVAAITSDHPIVANVAGSAVSVSGRSHAYGGHYVAIVGYGHNGNTVKIADPADTDGSGSYWMSTVDAANWIATRGYAVN